MCFLPLVSYGEKSIWRCCCCQRACSVRSQSQSSLQLALMWPSIPGYTHELQRPRKVPKFSVPGPVTWLYLRRYAALSFSCGFSSTRYQPSSEPPELVSNSHAVKSIKTSTRAARRDPQACQHPYRSYIGPVYSARYCHGQPILSNITPRSLARKPSDPSCARGVPERVSASPKESQEISRNVGRSLCQRSRQR